MNIASFVLALAIGPPAEPAAGDVGPDAAAPVPAPNEGEAPDVDEPPPPQLVETPAPPVDSPAASPAASPDLVDPNLAGKQPDEGESEDKGKSDKAKNDKGKSDEGKSDDEGEDKKDKQGKQVKKVKFQFGGRIIAGAILSDEAAAVDSNGEVIGTPVREGKLQLRQARLKFDLRYLDILRIRASAELADLIGTPEAGDIIRDAWANVRIHDAFQIKFGNFKRAYSRLQLRGAGSIPFIGRGLFNSAAVENLRWGDRAVGLGLWGKITPERKGLHEFGWAVNVSNNVLSGSAHGVDVHARVTYDPLPWMSIGLGGAYKHVQDPLANETDCRDDWRRDPGCRRDVFATDADVVFQVKGLYASIEANLAQDWTFADTSPWMLGTLAYASYDFEVGKRTTLQPVLFGEYVDTNLSFGQSEAVRGVGGLNILWTKHLRVMPQAQVVVPLAPVTAFNQFTQQWRVGLWVQVQM